MSVWPARLSVKGASKLTSGFYLHFQVLWLTPLLRCCFVCFTCLWCNTKIVAIWSNVRFHHTLPFIWRNKVCSLAVATSRWHKKLQDLWYRSRAIFSTQIMSFSPHLCSRRDARIDNYTHAERTIRAYSRVWLIHPTWDSQFWML